MDINHNDPVFTKLSVVTLMQIYLKTHVLFFKFHVKAHKAFSVPEKEDF